jgi:cell wall-associated NlpC family hydrolase
LRASTLAIALSAALIGPVLQLSAGPALAQDSAADIEAQIDAAWRKLEPIIEEHNGIRTELKERQRDADKLAERIDPLELQLELARSEVSEVAVRSFKNGNVSTFKALLTTGSPLTFVEQLTVLDRFAKSQQDKIAEVIEAKERYEAEKAELDALVAELKETEAKLAERADKIDADIDELQALHDELVAQERAASGGFSDTGNAGDCPAGDPGGAAGTAIRFACAQIGKPYGWGQSGPSSYDCSGLTSAAWGQAGISLPHNAAQQRNAVRYVERSDLRPGDLVFYYSDLSHVAMYAGGGYVVHASRAGVPVGMAPVDQSPVHSYGRPG